MQKNQTIDAKTIQNWRAYHLELDDVFDSTFLQGIIFGGVTASELHLTNDTKELLRAWQTQTVTYEPNLNLDNGPYYIHEGRLYSVYKVYQDRQLAFVQATWPSTAADG